MAHVIFFVELRVEPGDFELQKDAPRLIVEVDDRTPFDVRPVPASGDERSRHPREKSAAAVEKLQQFRREVVMPFVACQIMRQQKEIGGLEVAVRPALFDDAVAVVVGPRGKMFAHFPEGFVVFREGDPFGNAPSAVGRVDDARPPEPGEVAFQCPFDCSPTAHKFLYAVARRTRVGRIRVECSNSIL